MIIPISYYTCLNIKFNTCVYEKNIDKKSFIRTKTRNKKMKLACIEISFFAIFCISYKQKTSVNNK